MANELGFARVDVQLWLTSVVATAGGARLRVLFAQEVKANMEISTIDASSALL
jgi:hypothetical protein